MPKTRLKCRNASSAAAVVAAGTEPGDRQHTVRQDGRPVVIAFADTRWPFDAAASNLRRALPPLPSTSSWAPYRPRPAGSAGQEAEPRMPLSRSPSAACALTTAVTPWQAPKAISQGLEGAEAPFTARRSPCCTGGRSVQCRFRRRLLPADTCQMPRPLLQGCR